jgi:hypothetical protein
MEPQESPIPAFRADGYLPEGLYIASEARACGDSIMIANPTEYQKAQEETRALEERLERLQQTHPIGSKGFTKAGIRKMIARLHEELAVYEGSEEARRLDAP